MGRLMTVTIDAAIRTWGPRVAEAAGAFESRWTVHALRVALPELAGQFEAQLERFRSSLAGGTAVEIDTEGARLCRAYTHIAAELAKAGTSNDAVMIGTDVRSGFRIAIGRSPLLAKRTDGAVWFSPDEIATMIALNDRLNKIAQVKAAFPGAEIGEVRSEEFGLEQEESQS